MQEGGEANCHHATVHVPGEPLEGEGATVEQVWATFLNTIMSFYFCSV